MITLNIIQFINIYIYIFEYLQTIQKNVIIKTE